MTRRAVGRIWAVIAVAVAVAFVAGFFANSMLARPGSGPGSAAVNDAYPYGECAGPCPQHSFPFSIDLVTVIVAHQGRIVYQSTSYNLITNAGEDTIIDGQMACGAAGSPPACSGTGPVYISLTTVASPTPSVSDNTCFNGNEYASGNGMNRALGTYSSGSQVAPYTHIIKNTFTYTGSSPLTITGVCMLNAPSGGTLFAEDALASTATVSANGDTLTITWTFTH